MKILFVAGFGPVVENASQSRDLYVHTLGIKFQEEENGYLHTGALEGSKAFALWPLDQAAESCFGSDKWPEGVRKPNAWIEFDVEDIEEATNELKKKGYQLLVSNRLEPWGQNVTRFLSPEGLLLGITRTPWLRD